VRPENRLSRRQLCDGRGSGLTALGLLKIPKTRLLRVSLQARPRKLRVRSLFGSEGQGTLCEADQQYFRDPCRCAPRRIDRSSAPNDLELQRDDSAIPNRGRRNISVVCPSFLM